MRINLMHRPLPLVILVYSYDRSNLFDPVVLGSVQESGNYSVHIIMKGMELCCHIALHTELFLFAGRRRPPPHRPLVEGRRRAGERQEGQSCGRKGTPAAQRPPRRRRRGLHVHRRERGGQRRGQHRGRGPGASGECILSLLIFTGQWQRLQIVGSMLEHCFLLLFRQISCSDHKPDNQGCG